MLHCKYQRCCKIPQNPAHCNTNELSTDSALKVSGEKKRALSSKAYFQQILERKGDHYHQSLCNADKAYHPYFIATQTLHHYTQTPVQVKKENLLSQRNYD